MDTFVPGHYSYPVSIGTKGYMALELELMTSRADSSATFLQSAYWAAFKSDFGWRAYRFRLVHAVGSCELSVLVRSLGLGQSFAYIPHGPELDVPEAEQAQMLAELGRALKPQLPRSCMFIRFDPPWFHAEEQALPDNCSPVTRPAYGTPLVKSTDVQPPDTVLVDLRPDDDAILGAMKSKWRYNIRLAEKKGVRVAEEGRSALGLFYELYETTSKRDGIALHARSYYEKLFERANPDGVQGMAPASEDLRLWVARHEGQALAAIITVFHGKRAVYLYGASSDEKRSLMPAYALQWAAMKAAKRAGCTDYDMYGIPPSDVPGHPMAGLYRFKTGFGGSILHYAGAWDLPYKALPYAAFRVAEQARMLWHKKVRKAFKRGGGAGN